MPPPAPYEPVLFSEISLKDVGFFGHDGDCPKPLSALLQDADDRVDVFQFDSSVANCSRLVTARLRDEEMTRSSPTKPELWARCGGTFVALGERGWTWSFSKEYAVTAYSVSGNLQNEVVSKL